MEVKDIRRISILESEKYWNIEIKLEFCILKLKQIMERYRNQIRIKKFYISLKKWMEDNWE